MQNYVQVTDVPMIYSTVCLAIRIDGQSSNSLLVTYLGRLTRRVYSLWRLWHAATKDGVPSDTEL